MTFFFLFVIGTILIGTFRNKRDFFHPTRIYILLYLLLFSVYFMHLCRFQDPWSPTTLMLYWGAVISFVGGGILLTFYVRYLLPDGKQSIDLPNVSCTLIDNEKLIDWNWFLLVTTLVFSFFVVSYIYSYLKFDLIPITSKDPSTDRFLFLSGNMFTAFSGGSGPLVMMLSAEVLFVKTTTRTQKIIAGVLMLLSFGLYFTLVTRMPLVRSCIYIAVLYHYLKKQVSFRLIAFFALLAILFFVFGSIIRADITGFSELAKSLRINVPDRFILFINPYAYAVNNIWNMDFGFKKFIDGLHEYNISYGFEMFRGLFYYLNIESVLQQTYNFDSLFNESVVKVSGLNTVLYVWHFYKDFGVLGVFAVSLFLSTILHTFYYNTLIAPTHLRIAAYGLIISMIVFSFMVPLWSFWNIYYESAVILLAHKMIKIV